MLKRRGGGGRRRLIRRLYFGEGGGGGRQLFITLRYKMEVEYSRFEKKKRNPLIPINWCIPEENP